MTTKDQQMLLRWLRRIAWSAVALFSTYIACRELPDWHTGLRPMADFEDQESVLISWKEKHKGPLLEVIAAIARRDHVTIFYNERARNPRIIEGELLRRQVNMANISLRPFQLDKENIWIRDFGPAFLRDEQGQTVVVGFQYPHLAMKDYDRFNDLYTGAEEVPFFKSRIFGVGGGREINGRGTTLLVESYEKEINPGLSKEEIEQEYRQRFNQQNIIWLKRGIPQDDFFGHGPVLENIYGYGVGGHVDEFCRFADPNTILLAEVDSGDLARDTFYNLIRERLEENYRILSQARDQDGQPFRIVRVPQAPVLFATGELEAREIIYTPVTSYLNFIITNHLVIIPSYWEVGDPDYVRQKDEQARAIFQQVFPTREVVAINPIALNYDGGGLHCISIPKHGPTTGRNTLRKRQRSG